MVITSPSANNLTVNDFHVNENIDFQIAKSIEIRFSHVHVQNVVMMSMKPSESSISCIHVINKGKLESRDSWYIEMIEIGFLSCDYRREKMKSKVNDFGIRNDSFDGRKILWRSKLVGDEKRFHIVVWLRKNVRHSFVDGLCSPELGKVIVKFKSASVVRKIPSSAEGDDHIREEWIKFFIRN